MKLHVEQLDNPEQAAALAAVSEEPLASALLAGEKVLYLVALEPDGAGDGVRYDCPEQVADAGLAGVYPVDPAPGGGEAFDEYRAYARTVPEGLVLITHDLVRRAQDESEVEHRPLARHVAATSAEGARAVLMAYLAHPKADHLVWKERLEAAIHCDKLNERAAADPANHSEGPVGHQVYAVSLSVAKA